MKIKGSKVVINFNHTGAGLYCFDSKTPTGFTICGEDQKFVWASAKLIGKESVEIWADSVSKPIAVRYAWADNPVCNLYLRDGGVTLPVTPFRTDSFPLTTMGK
jgi:sialate O-acetylesterase